MINSRYDTTVCELGTGPPTYDTIILVLCCSSWVHFAGSTRKRTPAYIYIYMWTRRDYIPLVVQVRKLLRNMRRENPGRRKPGATLLLEEKAQRGELVHARRDLLCRQTSAVFSACFSLRLHTTYLLLTIPRYPNRLNLGRVSSINFLPSFLHPFLHSLLASYLVRLPKSTHQVLRWHGPWTSMRRSQWTPRASLRRGSGGGIPEKRRKRDRPARAKPVG